jgi:hypothetical protein
MIKKREKLLTGKIQAMIACCKRTYKICGRKKKSIPARENGMDPKRIHAGSVFC